MDKSRPRQYRIKGNNEELLYSPLEGHLNDLGRKKTYVLNRRGKPRLSNEKGYMQAEDLFKPFCLTIYAGNKCNLNCTYCYIPEKREIPSLCFDTQTCTKAARFVAQNCLDQGMPFILGFHGGNEPLLYTGLIREVIEICRKIADEYRLPLQTYCTTHGVVSEKVATWASQTFYGITLSWDGPADIHDAYRLRIDGSNTESQVRRSLEIFNDDASQLHFLKARATISRSSVSSMLEIVQYFHRNHIRHVDLYPVYQDVSATVSSNLIPDPVCFVSNFLKAKKWGEQRGMTITYANTRSGEFHDKHCSVFQQNLTLTPDGHFTACFQATHNFEQQHDSYMYGYLDSDSESLDWDQQKLSSLFDQLKELYDPCRTCFNVHHCAKECPTICPITTPDAKRQAFDCRIEKWIGIANILQAAKIDIPDIDDYEKYFSQFLISSE